MNSLEAEYSFLAPTWKLPPVGTSSMYPAPRHAPEASTKNNTNRNPRYVPPNAARQGYPQMNNNNNNPQHQGGRLMQSHPQPTNNYYRNNEYSDDNLDFNEQRTINYNQPIQKRVQIIDHNRQTPSSEYISERESQNSYSPDTQRKMKPHDNKSDSTHGSAQRANNFNIHDYLYGLSAPDPGSYVNAYRNQRRRLEDEKVNRKSVLTEYKSFVQNGGFGPAFGNTDHQTYEDKLDTEKKRKTYSKFVREVNQFKVEEHKRMQNNGGQQRNRTYVAPVPKHRRPEDMRSHFLSAQEPRLSIVSPILPSTPGYILNSPVLRQDSFDNFPVLLSSPRNIPALREDSFVNLHPWNQNDILTGEFYIDQSRFTPPYRIRFHNQKSIQNLDESF